MKVGAGHETSTYCTQLARQQELHERQQQETEEQHGLRHPTRHEGSNRESEEVQVVLVVPQ